MQDQASWRQSLLSGTQSAILHPLLIGSLVLAAFFPLFKASFVGDDWIFYELAGRLSLSDYLVKYFDPRVQTAWYRPVQGVFFRIGYLVFGANTVGYHLVNVLIHLANCLLLSALSARVTGRRSVGLLAALLYATFPIATEAVFKPGVVDPLTTLFYLATLWFWLNYLAHARRRDYAFAFAGFLLTLLSKEIGVTLPIILLLVDRLFVQKPETLGHLARRYLGFALVWAAYAPVEWIVTRRSVFVSHEGYQLSIRLIGNFLDYLAGMAFPWSTNRLVGYVALVGAAALLLYAILIKRHYALLIVLAAAVLAFLPIIPFPEVSYRFLYLSLTATAFLYALLLDRAWRALPSALPVRGAAFAGLALLVAVGGLGISNAAIDFGEFGRVSRVAFRNISQAHPTFPPDTFLYFIDPPIPGPNLSGMFFWRYGPTLSTNSTDGGAPADLRDHAVSYVYYFDAKGDFTEQKVDNGAGVRATPALPVNFVAPLRLEGFEIPKTHLRKNEAIILLSYWRGLGHISKDYTLFVHLLSADGKMMAGYDHAPRSGKALTSTWVPDQWLVDASVMPLPPNVRPGDYTLEIGLYDVQTMGRVRLAGANGQTGADHILIGPVSISDEVGQ